MSADRFQPFTPLDDGGVESHLPPDLRALLAGLCDQLEKIVRTEDPTSDPAVARLYPAAYPDDPLSELEYERHTADDLTAGRLETLERMRATTDADRLDEATVVAWLRTLNDLRLVMGIRLDVQETSDPDDFAENPDAAAAFELYAVLSEIQALLLRALDPEAVEPPGVEPGADPPA